ncbi:hypothetical protein GCM10023350_29710 [Nocardioides endophyticus]|uniref:Uncharacterized protein n=1 Tax=Nocardioides endophyticus TaxID=1353775 RepID=A0ABP8YYB0_9ACTN
MSLAHLLDGPACGIIGLSFWGELGGSSIDEVPALQVLSESSLMPSPKTGKSFSWLMDSTVR